MIIDSDAAQWITFATIYFDAILVLHERGEGWQPFLFPRTLCQGRRLILEPVTPRRRRRKRLAKR